MRIFVSSSILALITCSLLSQPVSNEIIRQRIASYKADPRGPYKEIRWYCPDGSIIPPKEQCPEPGGVQRARHKDDVTKLAERNHIFLGQILATTLYNEFWDSESFNSRLKQYQLEKYLFAADNGWVLHRAQYYRGAYQAEDEEQWGINFFNWLLSDDLVLQKQFFLVRQAAKDIPHKGDDNLKQDIRMISKEISDSYAAFLDLRVKIHGQPDASDIQKVAAFREKHKSTMTKENLDLMDKLIKELETQYKPFDIASLNSFISLLPKETSLRKSLTEFQSGYENTASKLERIIMISIMLEDLRNSIPSFKSSNVKLAVLDISIIMEDLLFKETSGYESGSLQDHITSIYYLGMASAACGYLEIWEWEELKERIKKDKLESLTETELVHLFEACRSITEWGTGMYMAVYEDIVLLYSGFEPLAEGFIDEKVRSSLLLQVGIAISKFSEQIATYLPVANQIMDLRSVGTVRGLNPGFTKGELVVISGQTENTKFNKNNIYLFNKPPSDLKPVAGIATVSEGNPVSHIQLLARNLGIPNAVFSLQNLEELKKYSGEVVFYAVSPGGVVIMKPENEMTSIENTLFEKKTREEIKIAVPTDKIDLSYMQVLSLREVTATSSGKICGPKAANLGQLKQLFPENVVEGLVVPFGIFRDHLNQAMPGNNITYWEYLEQIFSDASAMKIKGVSDSEIDDFMLAELAKFQKVIKQVQLTEYFIHDLQNKFREVFGQEMGNIAVFLRSDTNMEDLKDFTGAGLNLTLFNVVSPEVILQGIRDVWASPYTERSYKWRQRYLTNPENVFPSIVIIPSVDVDYSGVLVTKGLGQVTTDGFTAAFSLGAGGAVDGQAAESYLLKQNGENVLLIPSREPTYNKLPTTGGVKKYYATFEKPILNDYSLAELRSMGNMVKTILPKTHGIETSGPFDIELGFKDNKLWLFQVRPFVENKAAPGKGYLESLDPKLNNKKILHLQ